MNPVGHIFLERKSIDYILVCDEVQRLHYHYPRTGPSCIINRAQKSHVLTNRDACK